MVSDDCCEEGEAEEECLIALSNLSEILVVSVFLSLWIRSSRFRCLIDVWYQSDSSSDRSLRQPMYR